MAAPDHTALVRQCFATEGTLAALPDRSRVAGKAEVTPSPLTQKISIAPVMDISRHRSADSDARKRRQSRGWLAEPHRWPFIPVYPDGTDALIRRRCQRAEVGVSPER